MDVDQNNTEYPNKKVNKSVLDFEHRQLINKIDMEPSKSVKHEQYISSNSSGMLMALVAKDAQDHYVNYDSKMFDARLQFLNGLHQFSYQKIDVKINNNYNKVYYTFNKVCDLVNKIDLVLPNPLNLSLNKIINCIETTIGDQRLDKIGYIDIETLIKTDCALFKRNISHINGKTFVPLNMAPLYNHNMIEPSNEFKIIITYNNEYEQYINDVELYGNIYYLNTPEHKLLKNCQYSFITIQHQYTGAEKLICGHTAFTLYFNHPVYLIYFWGFDKSKVRNIRLCLNGRDFYNGSPEALENYKLSRGFDVEPMMMFFSQDDFDKPTKSTINFSRINSAKLLIQSDQSEPTDVHIVALNLKLINFANGMMQPL